jgi:hypothetical protein
MSERALGEPEVMGAAEAARTLGVAQSNLRKVVGLPDPYQRLRSGTLWRADEIRALAWRRLARATTTTTTHQPVA